MQLCRMGASWHRYVEEGLYIIYIYREDRASAAQKDRMGTVWHSYRMGMA